MVSKGTGIKQKAIRLLLRPDVSLQDMINELPRLKEQLRSFSNEAIEQTESFFETVMLYLPRESLIAWRPELVCMVTASSGFLLK